MDDVESRIEEIHLALKDSQDSYYNTQNSNHRRLSPSEHLELWDEMWRLTRIVDEQMAGSQ